MTKKKIFRCTAVLCLLALIITVCGVRLKVKDISEEDVPLASATYKAYFYVNKTSTDSSKVSILKCSLLGKGTITESMKSRCNDVEKIQSIISSAPSGKLQADETIEWQSMYYSLGTYHVIGKVIKTVDSSENKNFDTVQQLLKSNLEVGDMVSTLGFEKAGDGGAADYEIVAADVVKENGLTVFKLDNGNCAQLKYNKDTIIDLKTIGIFPENFQSKTFNKALELLTGDCKGVQFAEGKYYVDSRVYLKSMGYYGTGNTQLVVDDRYTTAEFNIISAAASSTPYDIEMKDLDFIFYTSSDHILSQQESCLVSLRSINSCNIDNCNFLSTPSEKNGAYMRVDLLWFHQTDCIQNVSITNSTFKSLSASALGDGSADIAGGCLWVSGPYGTQNSFDNIVIKNCDFETTVHDEAIAFWNGDFSNVLLSGCNISNRTDYDTDNLVAFYHGGFHNTVMENCNINVKSIGQYVMKTTGLTSASDIAFNNCNFSFDCGTTDTEKEAFGVFLSGADYLSYSGESKIVIDQCSFTGKEESAFRALITSTKIKDRVFVVKDSKIDMKLNNGIGYAQSSEKVQYDIVNNIINTHSYLADMNADYDVEINVKGNTFKSNPKTVVRQKAGIDFMFANNKCLADVDSFLYASWIDESNAYINIVENGNTVDDTKYSVFKASNKIDESKIVTISQ